jgi:hypothetical protein
VWPTGIVVPGECLLQRGHDRGPIGGVGGGLRVVAAHDIAPPGRLDFTAVVVIRGANGVRLSTTSCSHTNLSLRSPTPGYRATRGLRGDYAVIGDRTDADDEALPAASRSPGFALSHRRFCQAKAGSISDAGRRLSALRNHLPQALLMILAVSIAARRCPDTG